MTETNAFEEKEIQDLLAQLPQIVTPDYVYEEASKMLDTVSMVVSNKETPLTMKEVGWNFAYAGFCKGVEFALRNLMTVKEGDTQ